MRPIYFFAIEVSLKGQKLYRLTESKNQTTQKVARYMSEKFEGRDANLMRVFLRANWR